MTEGGTNIAQDNEYLSYPDEVSFKAKTQAYMQRAKKTQVVSSFTSYVY